MTSGAAKSADADTAAVAIQAAIRGRAARRPGDGAGALTLKVGSVALTEATLAAHPVMGSVWVEVDLLGLTAAELRTPNVKPLKSGRAAAINFEHSVPLRDGSAEVATLKSALSSPDAHESDVFFNVMGGGASGPLSLGIAHLNVADLMKKGVDADGVKLDLRGDGAAKGAGAVGSLEVSLEVMGAIQRLMAPDDVRIVVSGLALDPDAAVDGGVGDLWVEVDLPGVPKQAAAALRTDAVHKSAAPKIDFGFSASVALPPGSRTREAFTKAVGAAVDGGGSGEAAVYFHLKTRDARGLEKEVATGALDLADLARDGRDAVGVAVALHGAGGRQHALTASVFASELLATLGPAGFGRNDALKIGVGQLALTDALRRTTTGSSSTSRST